MDKENFNLSPKEILDKEFKIDTRGFRIKEVDAFLDEIIEDYEHYDKIIRDFEREKAEFQDETYPPSQRTINRRNNVNYNYGNTNSQDRKTDLIQTNKEKIIISKLIEKKGFLFIFNLLIKPTLSRVDPLEKYFDDLIGSVGLLKVALIIFQIYFENQFNSEKSDKRYF